MPRANAPLRDSVASTSAVRKQFVERLVALLVPYAHEGIPKEDFPPGVDEPYRPEGLQRIDWESGELEELAAVSHHAGTDVGLEVVLESGTDTDLASGRNRVEKWLQEPNPALAWRSPDDILVDGDESEREYLFGLIAGIECGVHS